MLQAKWSQSSRQYYTGNKPVSETALNNWIATTVDNARLRVRSLTQDYVDGKINHAEWNLAMQNEIKIGSRAMAQLANGGNLSPSMLGSLGAAVREQNKYLMAFASDVENGLVGLGPGLIARAEMYAEGLWARYQNFVRLREKGAGMASERLVLGVANHCDDCPADAALGWVEIGTLANIGSRTCLSRCRCHFEYRAEVNAIGGLRLIA